jgi:hypothetical protein
VPDNREFGDCDVIKCAVLPVIVVRLAYAALSRRDSVDGLSHDGSSGGEETEDDLHLGDFVVTVSLSKRLKFTTEGLDCARGKETQEFPCTECLYASTLANYVHVRLRKPGPIAKARGKLGRDIEVLKLPQSCSSLLSTGPTFIESGGIAEIDINSVGKRSLGARNLRLACGKGVGIG